MELLDKQEQIPLLLTVREIHLRLWLGPPGELLKSIHTHGTQSHRILRGINRLRDNFKEPLDVDALAGRVKMAPPVFRKHFKAVTSMIQTQCHKHLRLYEAQRLMPENNADAADAGYVVGHESPARFNRECKRLFGDPPAGSRNRLR